jgi:hypothetical protein
MPPEAARRGHPGPRGPRGRRRLRNPAAIIVDYDSRERGYLEWQDEKSSKMDGNGAAWSRPRSHRKGPDSLAQTKAPPILTFRASGRTRWSPRPDSKTQSIGRQPVALLETDHGRDRTSTPPPRADGVAAWRSDKIGDARRRRDRARSQNARTACVSHHEMSWRGEAAWAAIDGYYPAPTGRGK